MTDREAPYRKALAVVALILWAGSLTLSWLIIDKTVSSVKHPGLGLIVFMAQGLAITATIVWAQFRNRKVMIEVLRTGMELGAQNAKKPPTPGEGDEGR